MIKDYQNKEVLAEMQRQLNAAAKISNRDARITFVLMHMISQYRVLSKPGSNFDSDDNFFKFISWCLSHFVEDLETLSNEESQNPIDFYKKNPNINLLDLIRFYTPAKNAVEKGLDEGMEWPDDVPYEEWKEDILQTAYATLFGLYYFNTPAKDLIRWLGEDEPKNHRFVNAMNRHETVLNVSADRFKLHEADGSRPRVEKSERIYVSDEQLAKAKEEIAEMRRNFFAEVVGQLATGDTLRFCREKEETAFAVFMSGMFAMMMPDEKVNRKGMISSRDNAKLVYQAAKEMLLGDKVIENIVTADDDKAAAEVFYWGLISGEHGVANGLMPTGLADLDVRRKCD